MNLRKTMHVSNVSLRRWHAVTISPLLIMHIIMERELVNSIDKVENRRLVLVVARTTKV